MKLKRIKRKTNGQDYFEKEKTNQTHFSQGTNSIALAELRFPKDNNATCKIKGNSMPRVK